jgi:hypothetical protein
MLWLPSQRNPVVSHKLVDERSERPMMGAAFYVMAILGCGDDGATCQDVRLIETRYISADACAVATSAMLVANSDVAFPMVVAQCRPANAAMVHAKPIPPGG